jgi:arsenical pump membrane protein
LEGVFDWLAALAVGASNGSRSKLFALVYVVGTVVTIFLSNDATAVVLTPAVYAAVKKAGVNPQPYLLICAFIANAASFVLPISNPANLVVYGTSLPPLLPWLRVFLLPSIGSIVGTYLMLRWLSRKEIRSRIEAPTERTVLSRAGKRALCGMLLTGAILIAASARGVELGLPTLIAAAFSVLIATPAKRSAIVKVIRGVSWSVLPLVAGLFVLVEGVGGVGASTNVGYFLQFCSAMPHLRGSLSASFGVAALSNLINNLPSGLLVGGALQTFRVPLLIRNSVLIGTDLGPNLSVTGSLATVLWLIALRREGEQIDAWRFLKAGALVMPSALLVAIGANWLLSR